MTALSDEPAAGSIPADVAVRLLRALDRAPSAVLSPIDPDLPPPRIAASGAPPGPLGRHLAYRSRSHAPLDQRLGRLGHRHRSGRSDGPRVDGAGAPRRHPEAVARAGPAPGRGPRGRERPTG